MSLRDRTEVMAVPDAHLLWLSAKVPNDQFLLYAFEGEPDVGAGIDEMRQAAQHCGELLLRSQDSAPWRYPRWVRSALSDQQFVVHPVTHLPGALDALARLDQLDTARMAWRVHVFPPAVVVVQIAHALGDGTRSAALAAALLGRQAPLPAIARPEPGFLPRRAIVAAREHRRLARDIAAGSMPSPGRPRPALSVNARPAGPPVLRTLLVDRETLGRRTAAGGTLSQPTVTVGALVAIAEALGGYLTQRGEDVGELCAEVAMADDATPVPARNNFRNVTVGLHPELPREDRTVRIAAELAAHRRRGEHPAARASAAAFAATPAALLRWGVGHFDPEARSATVSGHTVVSSINRGPADLRFGGSPVCFTAGFPALSPMMSLTHGVHGIGGTVAVSVRADSVNVDVDGYLQRLADALGCQP